MKLFKKEEIDQRKALDRQREIEEGLKLSRRVDTLREVAAEEEASLEKFRRETVARIQAEIAVETKKKDALQAEVRKLEARRSEATESLVERENRLADAEKELQERREELEWRKDGLSTLEANLRKLEREIAEDKERVRYTQQIADENRQDAVILKEGAERTEKQADEILAKAETLAKEKMHKASEREAEVIKREKVADLREQNLIEREIKLNNDVIRLRDRESTLERNLKRHG